MSTTPICSIDAPLRKDDALEKDQLNRRGFAEQIVTSLNAINKDGGFVISLEGTWGSGKTSLISMVERVLADEPTKPIVVHFNPWLVGDRDALLKQFFGAILAKISATDADKKLKAVGTALKGFASALPTVAAIGAKVAGAGILAEIVQAIQLVAEHKDGLSKAGDTVSEFAEKRATDLNKARGKVVKELSTYTKPIVIFIDDIDRLTAAEVYEVIRIVKAVGDLPNLGFVLAWDSDYVCEALTRHGIPHAPQYLDKIVQLRRQIPRPSHTSMTDLVDKQLRTLPWDRYAHLSDGGTDDRVPKMWQQAMRPVVTTPRDIVRVFNHVRSVEESVRGQILLTDIIAMSTLAVLEPILFNAICKHPALFAGRAADELYDPLEFNINDVHKTRAEHAKNASLSARVQ